MKPARAIGLIALVVAAGLLGGARGEGWHWILPKGVAPPLVPRDNMLTGAKVSLGQRLFYDADLSINGTMACSTCHEQRRAFADGNATRPGVHGDPGRRNVPGLANVAWMTPLTWADPRLRALEAQVLVPVSGERPIEMGMKGNEAEIAKRLGRDGCYRRMFLAAFPEDQGRIDMTSVARALAAFERTMLSYDSPFDRYRRHEKIAWPEAAGRGLSLFRQRCSGCHTGANFTDGAFHKIADVGDDIGLADVTGKAADRGRFRTAPLRNVALTGPYLHDGSARTIEGAIAAHRRIGVVTPVQMRSLVIFLNQLTDTGFVSNPRLAYPDTFCGKPS